MRPRRWLIAAIAALVVVGVAAAAALRGDTRANGVGERHARDRERGQDRHARPGAELRQREHLAHPEHLQPARAAERDRHGAAAGSRDVVEDLEGGKTYTFNLRNAKFSDGTPLDGAGRGLLDPDRSKNFKGGWGFLLDAVKSVTAPNTNTLVITAQAAARAAARRPRDVRVRDRARRSWCRRRATTFFNKPVGSGPFMVTSLKKDQQVDLAVNPYWYGKKPNDQEREDPDRPERQLARAPAAEQEGRRDREPAGQPDRPDQQVSRACRATSSRRRASTSSSSTSTSRRSRTRTSARRSTTRSTATRS